MAGFSDIGVFLGYLEWLKVDFYTSRPRRMQESVLKGIVKRNKNTVFFT